jgi:nucleoside-diphosphate-sugar epimerase
MAETVEPNARMLTNTLEALAARNVPLRRIVLSGGAKSYGFSLGAFNAPAKETEPRLIAPTTITHRRTLWPIGRAGMERSGRSCVRIS